jgi:hypothetical protein
MSFQKEEEGVEGITLPIVVACDILLICVRSLISVGITMHE